MRSRILYTAGDGKFVETSWDKPEPTDDEIEVKAAMTGICRSDIDARIAEYHLLGGYWRKLYRQDGEDCP